MPTLRPLSNSLNGHAIVVKIASEGAVLDVNVDVHGPATARLQIRFAD